MATLLGQEMFRNCNASLLRQRTVNQYFFFVLSSPSRMMRWAGHVARMGEERGVYRLLVGKPEGRRPLGRPRRRWVDNIRTDLQEVGCGYMDWIGLTQDRDRWRTFCECGNEPSGSVKCGEFLD